MATAYTSTRFPVNYKFMDPSNVRNGSLARAGSFYVLADNQHWLAMADTELTNFYQGTIDNEWTNLAKTMTVQVPPFCQYAAFHFYAARDFDVRSSGASDVAGIKVVSPVDTRVIQKVPGGEDLFLSGKGTLSDGSYKWVDIDGIVSSPIDNDATALKLVTSPSETWTTVSVTVTMGSLVFCRSAGYNIIPNTLGYVVT